MSSGTDALFLGVESKSGPPLRPGWGKGRAAKAPFRLWSGVGSHSKKFSWGEIEETRSVIDEPRSTVDMLLLRISVIDYLFWCGESQTSCR